ncbi:hypothetical protein [Saccharothrix coeruleofusca]|uniref:Lipoprotein with Yx(FWY)xxD motif n=1 Tax=Saccharothrix coeruleofusca TaxID=33919 RepID=A0A918AKZ9_9PSEU|nr:hypothetical protein [Saccharothrix coeruleofusca]GGP50836.1 hypothetical protein GCM10010185_24020 [Saccharothrix coeruleofusca]
MTRTRAVALGAVAPIGAALLTACGQARRDGAVRATLGGLGAVLTDKDSTTLYRFDEGSANPSASTCDGACAVKWPPRTSSGDESCGEANGHGLGGGRFAATPEGKKAG